MLSKIIYFVYCCTLQTPMYECMYIQCVALHTSLLMKYLLSPFLFAEALSATIIFFVS